MPDVVDRLGAALLDASLAVIAISGLVVLAMIQSRQPARRLVWARAGLLSSLALLPLSALNPVPRIDLRDSLHAILPTDLDDPAPRARPTVDPIGPPACDDHHGPRWLRRVARGLVVAYGLGASIGLGWVALGLWGSAWVVRRARMPSRESLDHHRSLPFEESRSRPRPRLLVSDRASRPLLVGWLRPVILLPTGFDRPGSTDRLRLGLLHELAHAENLDHRFRPLATLAQAVWFFLPPVWWIRDQLTLDQEFLADRRAVAHFGTSGRYASSLVELAASSGPNTEAAEAATPTRSPLSKEPGVASALFQRVMMLLKCPFAIEGQPPLWWRWSTALTLGLTTLAASCLTLRGMAGWLDTPPSRPAHSSTAFRLAQLTIRQREQDEQPFDLRFRLPDRFHLSFEVMAEPGNLVDLEVLGHRLGPTLEVDRLWHRVEIHRADGSETVEVDARPPGSSKPTKLASWLTIRPSPGWTARIRDLVLHW